MNLKAYIFKTGVFFVCALLVMIMSNGINIQITIVHKFPDKINAKVETESEINHKTPYALRIINGY